ncbi:MAG: asparagine synthase (glutamine-hydrolyzing) [Saprospiraceae bacterium]|nr:asparagine synthase (glutamine-hydrolyzing) [Saprospiraceae bacterium]
MCGICGFNRNDQTILGAMLKKLQHRGPDHEGTFLNQDWSIGMRRLAIIDLSGGQQPVWNEDKSICAILNGEIYNYKKLRMDLMAKGHQLTTISDSEVIVHLYEEHGSSMFEFLDGMFAICIIDLKKNSCLLARDRFGEKPLYYYHHGQEFVFASEMQALLQYKNLPRYLHTEQLTSLLRFGYQMHPATLIRNVYTLNPGEYLLFHDGSLQITPYYKWGYDSVNKDWDEKSAVDEVRKLLNSAVEKQMVSDVPLGAFLSGGIDSSTISAILQKNSNGPINTFNVKFEEKEYDESLIARKVAGHIGSNHHEIFVLNAVFDEPFFWELLQHTGEPFVDSSCIPSYLVSKEIQKHLKVVLSGDGGDELFGGYDDFQWGNQINKLRSMPVALKSVMKSVLLSCDKFIPASVDTKRGLLKAIEISNRNEEQLIDLLYEHFTEVEIKQLITSNWQGNQAYKSPETYKNWSNLRKLMWFRTAYAMPDDMLLKIDRMSMRHSIEVRNPFLDKALFEFAATLPDHFLRKGKQNKWLIRKAMKPFLPEEVFSHPKQGFNFPLHKFFNKEFQLFCSSVIPNDHPLFEVLNREAVLACIKTGFEQKSSTSRQSIYKSAHKLWLMAQLFAWITHFNIDVQIHPQQA